MLAQHGHGRVEIVRLDAVHDPLVLVDELPRNSTGKLPRSGLQALYADRVGHGRG